LWIGRAVPPFVGLDQNIALTSSLSPFASSACTLASNRLSASATLSYASAPSPNAPQAIFCGRFPVGPLCKASVSKNEAHQGSGQVSSQ